MANDPVTWLADHIAAGIVIREDCRPLRTGAEVAAWDKRQLQWADELYSSIKARSPRDTARVEILDEITPQMLPAGHPWAEPPVSGMTVSSTGAGCLGNNPFSCHCVRIKRAKEIEREWRQAVPGQPKLPKTANAAIIDKFQHWYGARAAEFTNEGKRSSREQDRKDAAAHFGLQIPWEWINDERAALPAGHLFHQKGRPKGKYVNAL